MTNFTFNAWFVSSEGEATLAGFKGVARFASHEEAEIAAKAFPGYVKAKVLSLYGNSDFTALVEVRVNFNQNDANKGKNEIGAKRARKFLEIAQPTYTPLYENNSYKTAEAFFTQLAKI